MAEDAYKCAGQLSMVVPAHFSQYLNCLVILLQNQLKEDNGRWRECMIMLQQTCGESILKLSDLRPALNGPKIKICSKNLLKQVPIHCN